MVKTADVVAGADILTTWGNEIRDRTAQVFASAAERDAQWPAPPDGAISYTADTGTLWLRRAGAWSAIAGQTALCRAKMHNAGTAQTLPGGANTPLLFDTLDYDDYGGLCNLSAGSYLVAVAGDYLVTANWASTTVASSTSMLSVLQRNGALVAVGTQVAGLPTYGASAPLATVVRCAPGDTLRVIANPGPASVAAYLGPGYQYMTVTRI